MTLRVGLTARLITQIVKQVQYANSFKFLKRSLKDFYSVLF